MWQIPHSVARDLYRYRREILKYTQNTHTATCWAEQRPSNGGHTHIVKWIQSRSLTQYQVWVRCLVREKALAGRTLAPVPRCPGAALADTDGHETWSRMSCVTRVLMTSWWPWHGCHDVTVTSTLQQSDIPPQSQSHTCVRLSSVCLFIFTLVWPLSWDVWLFVFYFLLVRILYDFV